MNKKGVIIVLVLLLIAASSLAVYYGFIKDYQCDCRCEIKEDIINCDNKDLSDVFNYNIDDDFDTYGDYVKQMREKLKYMATSYDENDSDVYLFYYNENNELTFNGEGNIFLNDKLIISDVVSIFSVQNGAADIGSNDYFIFILSDGSVTSLDASVLDGYGNINNYIKTNVGNIKNATYAFSTVINSYNYWGPPSYRVFVKTFDGSFIEISTLIN